MVYSFTPSGHIDNIKIRVSYRIPASNIIVETDCNGNAIVLRSLFCFPNSPKDK
jgi:hypothetical protein